MSKKTHELSALQGELLRVIAKDSLTERIVGGPAPDDDLTGVAETIGLPRVELAQLFSEGFITAVKMPHTFSGPVFRPDNTGVDKPLGVDDLPYLITHEYRLDEKGWSWLHNLIAAEAPADKAAQLHATLWDAQIFDKLRAVYGD